MIEINKLLKLKEIHDKGKNDRLFAFVLNGEPETFDRVREDNLRLLFETSKKYNVRYLYVGRGEICGCENIHFNGWPVMWHIAKEVGFPGSCGNGDQYQCYGSDIAFPDYAYGGWDLETNTKLTDEEVVKMKFKRVVTDPWFSRAR